MKQLFDEVSIACSKIATKRYSTSFSLGITFLHKKFRNPIYAIYGFVRFADEIVDSFDGYDKAALLQKFKTDTYWALEHRISSNPILNSFQQVVHQYQIDTQWIDYFLNSMEMDLKEHVYTRDRYEEYILGSAEAVGLMCLHVFTENNEVLFNQLKPFARKLGSVFQKVNFLRDIRQDNVELGRTYFPEIDLSHFTDSDKKQIETEIELEFIEALEGIRRLPKSSRQGVYLAFYYYRMLFNKIKRVPSAAIMTSRIRIPNYEKILLMFTSTIRLQLNLL